MSRADERQPAPIRNDQPHVIDLVMCDLQARSEVGVQTYGVRLQPFNGRDALMDAYQEALNLCMCLRQALEERNARVRSDPPQASVTSGDPLKGEGVCLDCGQRTLGWLCPCSKCVK
jgi:hypothetical protein